MSGYWLSFLFACLVGFAVPEAYAIHSKQAGDTLSENIRLWFRTDTPGGGAVLVLGLVAISAGVLLLAGSKAVAGVVAEEEQDSVG